ncbi:hypothetical protein [Mangrovicoccus algicola]|uniref:Uncharacterized protein n=1 Tax=Mangrovicoccus algicola TaxID=2771008 RepID=A0A8J6Z654_9RHOB|nr:hypothetical protein [Mangrovicoccus algicola]MBE3637115.1 hypothetical protein [Mangrovicoccus algicola]
MKPAALCLALAAALSGCVEYSTSSSTTTTTTPDGMPQVVAAEDCTSWGTTGSVTPEQCEA